MNTIEKDKGTFAFDKTNYLLMAIGFLVVILGFILMAGGKAENPAEFSDKIFSTRRIVIAPIVILIGFGIEVYAIMKKSKPEKTSQN